MNFKSIIQKFGDFVIKRMIEFLGIFILIFAILIFLSLISYNPSDPNFIYPDNHEIKNILGINGSISADFLLQSIGLISYFLPITLIFLSVSIIYTKDIIKIVDTLFFIICYSVIGAIFLEQFYKEGFHITLKIVLNYLILKLFTKTF